MLDRAIIAQNITNLTDARYFAAWGVDYLSYNIIPDSPYYIDTEKVQEIIEWVEGPKTLIESMALEFLDFSEGHILSNIYQSLPLNKEAFFRIDWNELNKGLPDGKYILALDRDELHALKSLSPRLYRDATLFLDIHKLPLDSFDDWPDWGLVIQGGDEEKVGVKSFDELDELFDLLMDASDE